MRQRYRAARGARISGWMLVFLLLGGNWFAAFACTTFVLREQGELLLGRNLDWHTGSGLIIANPRGLEKVALVDPAEKPAKWMSKFGSITFNQVGRELPYGGINEAGLVVEHMSLGETEYPARDERSAISACQWIQFQLDTCSTVEEVIRSDAFLRIVDRVSRFHFLVCDRSGDVTVIEFLGGKMVSYMGETLPVRVLANSTYKHSLNCSNRQEAIETDRSLYNFVTAARMAGEIPPESPASMVAYGFTTLQSVSQGLTTKWSIVYDVKNLKVHVKVFETPTLVGEQKAFLKEPGRAAVKVVEVNGFDFDGAKPAMIFDLESDREGVINKHFTTYTTALNRESIAKAFGFLRAIGVLTEVGDAEVDGLAKYPETFGRIQSR